MLITELDSKLGQTSQSHCDSSQDPDIHINIKTSPRFGENCLNNSNLIGRSVKNRQEKIDHNQHTACSKWHNVSTKRPVTMGLEDYRKIPITDTEIVPFAVPHIPSRMCFGRIRKQIEHDFRKTPGRDTQLFRTQKFPGARRISVPATIKVGPFNGLNEVQNQNNDLVDPNATISSTAA